MVGDLVPLFTLGRPHVQKSPWPPLHTGVLPAAVMATPATRCPGSQPEFPSPAHMACLSMVFLVCLLPLGCHHHPGREFGLFCSLLDAWPQRRACTEKVPVHTCE